MTFVLIITGSRALRAAFPIEQLIEEHSGREASLEVVFGDCHTGADAFALSYVKREGISFERFCAQWVEHGPRQGGPIRNSRMIGYGAKRQAHGDRVLVVGFLVEGERNRGTKDTLKKAKRSGLAHELRWVTADGGAPAKVGEWTTEKGT